MSSSMSSSTTVGCGLAAGFVAVLVAGFSAATSASDAVLVLAAFVASDQARAITGTRWNGFTFFGLKNQRGVA